jgi:MSHA type pilus biogenesis protein MshL
MLLNSGRIISIFLLLILAASCSFEDAEKKDMITDKKGIGQGPGCCGKGYKDYFDPLISKTRQDYLDGLYSDGFKKPDEKKIDKKFLPRPAIPSLLNFVEGGELPKQAKDVLVSVSVTEEVPIKDVLFEISRKANVNVEMDSGISGGIILTAIDQPFSQVVSRICDLAGLVYEYTDGVLKITRDVPTVVNYRLNLINVNRDSKTTINSNTQIGFEGGGDDNKGSAGSFNSGSKSTIEINSITEDIWQTVEGGLKNLINEYNLTQGAFVSKQDEGEKKDAPADPNAKKSDGGYRSSILSLNKKSGIVSILATERQHKEIKAYLDYINLSNTSQVLIEAKVVEVKLNDAYRSGIEWNAIFDGKGGRYGVENPFNLSLPANQNDPAKVFKVTLASSLGLKDFNLDTAVELVQEFGTTRTLSSPRINAMNNQPAVLTFAKNVVYALIKVERQEAETSTAGTSSSTPPLISSIDAEFKSVPIGVILNLQPSIDLQRNEVVLSIRPTLTRTDENFEDPASRFLIEDLRARTGSDLKDLVAGQIPIVQVREIDTVMRLNDGQVAVIGGLMDETVVNEDTGIPGLSKIPFIGNLFKSVKKSTDITETVIFLKATINRGKEVEVLDKQFYKEFFPLDRRPIVN